MTTTSYTEFCCRSGGSNVNAGTTTGASSEESTTPLMSYTAGTWTQSTRTFVPASGTLPGTVAVGQFMSVFTSGATATGYVARITTVNAGSPGSIVLSSSVLAGAAPANGTYNARIGGAWLGPNTTDQAFPHTLAGLAALVTVTTSYPTRINYKNDQTYNITATTAYAGGGPLRFQGYTTSYGDGGKATLDGGTSGTSYILWNLTPTGACPETWDFIFKNNGASGSAAGFSTVGRGSVKGVVVNNVQGAGFTSASTTSGAFIECEAYACNLANNATTGGFQNTAGSAIVFDRCISHDNVGTATRGFYSASTGMILNECISASNGLHGIEVAAGGIAILLNSDFYNNGVSATGSGYLSSSATGISMLAENCNFVKNSGFGLTWAAATREGIITNCGFGSGTQVNGSGDIDRTTIGGITEIGTITYASDVTPWVDPANGDFRINLAAAENTGRGAFTETAASYAGTVGYPDVGAAQHLPTAGGGLLLNPGLRGGLA